jgi:NAD(P)-dependent dehydrogenase (short-subunit alcohol dehydrogenase family)
MGGALQDRTVLVVGGGGGIAREITLAVRDAGASVVAAGPGEAALKLGYDAPRITDEYVDLTDDAFIEALGHRLSTVDHVVSTASAGVTGRLADLDRDMVRLAFDTKVIGPIMLAKNLAPRMPRDGSFLFLSEAITVKPEIGTLAITATNGAVHALIRSLALELAPVRVNAISATSPGVINIRAWNALGPEAKSEYFRDVSARNTARRIGTVDDVAEAVVLALSSKFLTGATLSVGGRATTGAIACRF